MLNRVRQAHHMIMTNGAAKLPLVITIRFRPKFSVHIIINNQLELCLTGLDPALMRPELPCTRHRRVHQCPDSECRAECSRRPPTASGPLPLLSHIHSGDDCRSLGTDWLIFAVTLVICHAAESHGYNAMYSLSVVCHCHSLSVVRCTHIGLTVNARPSLCRARRGRPTADCRVSTD